MFLSTTSPSISAKANKRKKCNKGKKLNLFNNIEETEDFFLLFNEIIKSNKGTRSRTLIGIRRLYPFHCSFLVLTSSKMK